jgi:hypothetical protein
MARVPWAVQDGGGGGTDDHPFIEDISEHVRIQRRSYL